VKDYTLENVRGGTWANENNTLRWTFCRTADDGRTPRFIGLRALRVEVGP